MKKNNMSMGEKKQERGPVNDRGATQEIRMDRSRGTFMVDVFHGVPQDVSMVCFMSCCGAPMVRVRPYHRCRVRSCTRIYIVGTPGIEMPPPTLQANIPQGFPLAQLVASSLRGGLVLNYIF